MKKQNKNNKKLSLPLSEETKYCIAVLLEDIKHDFKVFGEVLNDVKEKGDATFEEVGAIKEKVTMFEISQQETNERLNNIENKLDNIKSRLDNIKKEIFEIKEEIKELKILFAKKVGLERIEKCELRINQLEKIIFELQTRNKK